MNPIWLLTISVSLLFGLSQERSMKARETQQIVFPETETHLCSTPEEESGRCLSLFDCEPLFRLLKKPSPKVFRYLRQSSCGFVQFEPMVCCSTSEPPEYLSQPDPVHSPAPDVTSFLGNLPDIFQRPLSSSQSNPDPEDTEGPDSVEKDLNPSEVPVESQPIVPTRVSVPSPEARNCGRSTVKRTGIVGGEKSPKGAWPWMTLLLVGNKQTGDLSGVCGGVLISDRHILTAAQCVTGESPMVVAVLGTNEYGKDEDDDESPQRILISDITVHEHFDPTKFQNDIAILKLSEPVEFSDTIAPICLPLNERFRSQDFTKKLPFVTGWGVTSEGVIGGEPHVVMRELQLQVVARSSCRRSYQDYSAAVIDNSVLCTYFPEDGKESCDGDAGGPLMLTHQNRFNLLGLVSNGKGCGQPHFPRIYTYIPNYIDWILSKLES